MNRDKQIAGAMQRLREAFPFAMAAEVAWICRYLHENDFPLDTDPLVLRAAEDLAGEPPLVEMTASAAPGDWGDVFRRWYAYTKRLGRERQRRRIAHSSSRRWITSTQVGKVMLMGLLTRVVQ